MRAVTGHRADRSVRLVTITRGGRQHTVLRMLVGTAVALLLVGCAPSAAKIADVPTNLKPTAPPEPDPVAGVVTLTVESVSNTRPLGLGSARAADDEAIQGAVDAIAAWLDRHLDLLQRGGDGALVDIAADGLADPDGHATTALASADRHVASAAYLVTVLHDGAPQLVAVEVTVIHRDGGTAAAELLFAVDGGEPVLTLFGPRKDQA
jgi:hypothetical protein